MSPTSNAMPPKSTKLNKIKKDFKNFHRVSVLYSFMVALPRLFCRLMRFIPEADGAHHARGQMLRQGLEPLSQLSSTFGGSSSPELRLALAGWSARPTNIIGFLSTTPMSIQYKYIIVYIIIYIHIYIYMCVCVHVCLYIICE